MSENYSAEAELILSVENFIRNAKDSATALRGLNAVLETSINESEELRKPLEAAQRALGGVERASKGATDSIDKGSNTWQQYVKDLKAANAEYAKFLQGQATGQPAGTSLANIKDPDKHIATAGAQKVDVVRDLLAERDAVEAVGQARLKANAEARASRVEAQASRSYSNISTEVDQAIRDRSRDSKNFSDGVRARMQATQEALTADHAAANAMNKTRDAQEKATRANNDHTTSLISTRYALYDVATTYGVMSTALLGVAALGVKTGADFESAFSGVERTTLDAAGNSVDNIDGIRESLVDLSTEMPVAFDEISRIATLGAQLGVAAEDLDEFASVVAKFSTVTGMTADATAQAFGRLSNLLGIPIEEAERLGSSIARVGVESASTEAEIIALAQRLASTASRAGFTTDQVVGLSGALGSLGVAPERAQGVFETYFNSLNSSIAEGGDKLKYFAQVTGLSTDAIETMVRSGQGFDVFQNFLAGLQGADSVEMTTALDALGLSGLRANEVVGRIAGNLPLLNDAFDDAAVGYAQNTELQNQYVKVTDDLNAQLAMLWQTIQAFADGGTGDLIPGLAGAVGGLKDLVNMVREYTDSGFGQTLLRGAAILVTLTGAFFAYKSVVALATASTYALVTANAALGAQGTRGGIAGLISALRNLHSSNTKAAGSSTAVAAGNVAVEKTSYGAARATTAASVGTARFATALKLLGRVTVVLAAVQLVSEVIFNSAETARKAADVWLWAQKIIGGSIQAIADNARKLSPIMGGIADLLDGYVGAGNDNSQAFSKWADSLAKTDDKATDLTDNLGYTTSELDDFGGSVEGIGDATDDLADKIVTLADYASDLRGVFDRAFEIRFGPDQALDQIQGGWNDVAKATADANQQIAEYQQTINELTADRKVLQYFKGVADKYGDTMRAGTLAASLEKNQNDLNKTTGDLSSAQLANSKTLSGNSSEAIANRANILSLVTTYQGYLGALASSGMSQQDLAAKSASLKAEFQAQATQAGYSATEIATYSAAFDGMTTAINGVPRNITVDGNTDPAMQALAEFLAAASTSTAEVPITSSGAGEAGAAAAADFSAAFEAAAGLTPDGSKGQGLGILKEPRSGSMRRSSSGSFADGGYTGDFGTSEAAGVVHGKEFVFSAPATKAIGVDKLAKLHKIGKSGRGYQGGGYVGSGGGGGALSGPTDLSAGSILALAEAIKGIQLSLWTEDRKIAESANRGQVQLANGGVA